MAQQQYIKHLYEVEERSLNEIKEITGFNFRTVQKYAYKEDWNEDHLPNAEPESYPVLGEFIPVINQWLEDDRKIPRKQRHTAQRIYDRLREELGFQGSYSSVKRYIRKKKYVMKMTTDGYLPLAQPKGCGQVDFGEFIYYDTAGTEQKAYALTVSFPYSNDEFNDYLWDWSEKDAWRDHYKHKVPIQELREEESTSLLALPEYPFSVFRYTALRVSKYGFVTIENNKYGLSPQLSGKTIQAKI